MQVPVVIARRTSRHRTVVAVVCIRLYSRTLSITGTPLFLNRSTMTAFLQRFLNVHRGEVAPLLVSALYFCCVLIAIGVMRPARDAIGMSRGLDEIPWLFVGTALVTLAVNPMFGWLVSRFRRLVFIASTYLFFAASLVAFYLLIETVPGAVGEVSGRVFYVWYSVFNL